MDALLAGANGFIEAAVVPTLLEAGHRVRAFVRPAADRRSLGGLPVEIVQGDVWDPGSLQAASYQLWTPDRPAPALHASNVEGTRNVLDVARRGGHWSVSGRYIGAAAARALQTA